MKINHGMRMGTDVEAKWNLAIDLFERGKRRRAHEAHNIFTNTGRQFLCENMAAAAFPTSSTFTRLQDSVVRYIGFGVGGNRQNSSFASTPPISVDYPGTNVQTDADVTVSRLERPVLVLTPSDLWMREVSPIGALTLATEVTFIATFSETDLLVGAASMPLSEIALYKSTADPSVPNGTASAYPGVGQHAVAYDTFDTIHKTGQFSVQVSWTIRF